MLDGRLARGLADVDVFGRLGVSTASAWSVCLDRWVTDEAKVGGSGC
jgi:hypothetical protein